jgi:medium-chain acyl-[acyl-carrier-protein] hydrolase
MKNAIEPLKQRANMVERTDDGWLVTFQPRAAARVRLFCLAHAGAGASLFASFRDAFPGEIELTAIQLPGREERLREPLPRRISDVIAQLLPILKPKLDRPYALFGYSLGAVLAYDLALRIETNGLRPPEHLFALARLAPQLRDPQPSFYDWPEDRFLAELQRRYGALHPVLLQNRDLLQIYVPIVRADLEMADTYEPPRDRRLSCPVTAISGTHDVWTHAEIAAWSDVTTGRFRRLTLPGGHFVLHDSRDELCRLVSETLASTPD